MSREKRKETRIYEVITCDFCSEDMENNLGFGKCPICNKDFCSNCGISVLQGGRPIDYICPDCFSQAMHGLVSAKVKEIVEAMD